LGNLFKAGQNAGTVVSMSGVAFVGATIKEKIFIRLIFSEAHVE